MKLHPYNPLILSTRLATIKEFMYKNLFSCTLYVFILSYHTFCDSVYILDVFVYKCPSSS